MSGERRRARRTEEEQLLRSLRRLGADHEPDVETIQRRIWEAEVMVRPAASPAGRQQDPALLGRWVLLPAAVILLVTGGIWLADPGGGSVPVLAPTTSTPAVPAETTTPTGLIGPAASITPAASSGPTVTTLHGAPSTSTGFGFDVRSAPVTAARTVTLASPPLLDWVVVGARADLKQVRAKPGSAPTSVGVVQPVAAGTDAGPFRVSWTGGVPEQDHTTAATWLAAPAGNGLTVTLTASSHRRTVTLYTGADAGATLSVDGAGQAPSRMLLRAAGSRSLDGLVVTVSLPPTVATTRLHLAGPADAPSTALVHLAAVAVS